MLVDKNVPDLKTMKNDTEKNLLWLFKYIYMRKEPKGSVINKNILLMHNLSMNFVMNVLACSF